MDRRALLGILGAVCTSSVVGPAHAEDRRVELLVVVRRESPLVNIDQPELRRVFAGEAVAESSGTKLLPLNHPAKSPDRVAFDRLVLDLSPEAVAKYWLDRKIRGQSGPPRTVPSLKVLLGVVARFPGAIGYVRSEYVSSDVRALKVSGQAPGSPGYRLVYVD